MDPTLLHYSECDPPKCGLLVILLLCIFLRGIASTAAVVVASLPPSFLQIELRAVLFLSMHCHFPVSQFNPTTSQDTYMQASHPLFTFIPKLAELFANQQLCVMYNCPPLLLSENGKDIFIGLTSCVL